jgi:hypothetical protein
MLGPMTEETSRGLNKMGRSDSSDKEQADKIIIVMLLT